MYAGGVFSRSPELAGATDGTVTTDGPSTVGTGSDAVPATGTTGATASNPVNAAANIRAVGAEQPWASPTAGPALTLDYLPPESQVVIALRPAQILASARGDELLQSLGPDLIAARAEIERATGLTWDKIDRLIVAVIPNGANPLRIAYRVEPAASVTMEDVFAAWGNPSAVDVAGTDTYPFAGGAGLFLPDGRSFLMASPDDIAIVVEQVGSPANLRKEIQDLAASSDADRQLTVIAVNAFFNGDGRKIFTGPYDRLYDALTPFLGDQTRATSLSLDVRDVTYAELRLIAEGRDDVQTATDLQAKLADMPIAIENYLLILNPSPYWRRLAIRLPQMVKTLRDYSRVGVGDRQAVVNVALPASAAPNLLVSAELLISTPPGAATVAAAGPSKPAPPKDYDELLQRKLSIEIPSLDLNLAVASLVEEVQGEVGTMPFKLNISILGKDLETGGITRNQQVRDFVQKDKTLAEILTAMMMKANPITTVTSPDQTDQKLIWVVAPDPDTNEPSILITTRDGAAKRSLTIPKVFQPAE